MDPKFNLESKRPPRLRSVEDVLNPAKLLALLQWRALVQVVHSGDRLDRLSKQGDSSDEAWNKCSLNLMQTARSHCYYFVASKFHIGLAALDAKDAAIKQVLSRLFAFFCCTNILSGEQWSGLVDGDESALIEEAICRLCSELRPDAVALVDAFDIPDRVLNSALGRYDGNVYEHLFASAKKCTLNQHEVFRGYEELLRPHLDLKFLALANQKVPDDFEDLSIDQVRNIAAKGRVPIAKL
jgi:acyl-CoA oxidase